MYTLLNAWSAVDGFFVEQPGNEHVPPCSESHHKIGTAAVSTVSSSAIPCFSYNHITARQM